MNISVRKGTKGDLPHIINLVKELARFEKEPDAVTADLTDYEESFSIGLFDTLVAVQDTSIVGCMLFYDTFSTWKGRMLYLEDFVISEKHRGKGIGKALMDQFISFAKEEKYRLIKWEVIDWNKPAIEFYKKYNVAFENYWINAKIML